MRGARVAGGLFDRCAGLGRVCLLLCAVGGVPVGAAPPIWAFREWERLPVKDNPSLAGKDRITAVFYSYPVRQVALAVEQVVDPAKNDALVPGQSQFKYLGEARWGWIPWGFFSPSVERGGGAKPLPLAWGPLVELNVLEADGDRRVMADFVWTLLRDGVEDGRLVLRCVVFRDDPLWVYMRVMVAGDGALQARKLSLVSMAGAGRRQPGSEVVLSGATRTETAPAPGTRLPLDEYWTIVEQTRENGWFENLGVSAVFLPEDLRELVFEGHWNGGVGLVPPDGARSLRFAICDYRGPAEKEIARLRREAPERRERLRSLDWRPDAARGLRELAARVEPLLAGLADDDPAALRWRTERAAANAAVAAAAAAGPGDASELRCAALLQGARSAVTAILEDLPAAIVKREGR